MKLYERKMALRIYVALNEVPGAYIGGGTKSTTVRGVVSFGNDMQKLRSMLMDALAVMMDGAIADVDRQSAFDDAMKLADDYIARRKAEGWECT
jgi:hypothetical protein